MCTTSIVRFRFSLKDNLNNLTNSQTLTDSHRSEAKLISLTGIGLKRKNQYITEDINMNKGLSNGHQFSNSLSNNIDINVNNNTNNTITTTSTTPSTTVSTCMPPTITASDTTMGLLNSNSKDNLTQHLLLNSLKGGKPENGQRIDFTNISWNDLKQTNTNNISSDNKTCNDVSQNSDTNQLETNNQVNDQSVQHLTEEGLQQNQSLNEEQVKEEPKPESNSCAEEQEQQQLQQQQPLPREESLSSAVNELNEEKTTTTGCTSHMDVKEQQILLEKQAERLMRRIRRLQFKQTHRHITKQMKAFVEHQQIVKGIPCQRQTDCNVNLISQLQSVVNPVEDRMKLLTPEGVKGLSTSALVNLVKRLGSTSTSTTTTSEANHLHDFYSQTPLRSLPQTASPTPTSTSSGIPSQVPQTPTQLLPNNSAEETTLVKLLQKSQASSSTASASQLSRVNPEDKEAIISTIDTLTANLRHFESGFDSDATESSSGGESCDEFEDYNQDLQQHSTPTLNTGHFIPM